MGERVLEILDSCPFLFEAEMWSRESPGAAGRGGLARVRGLPTEDAPVPSMEMWEPRVLWVHGCSDLGTADGNGLKRGPKLGTGEAQVGGKVPVRDHRLRGKPRGLWDITVS